MKKITLFFALLSFAFQSKAQVIYTNTFDTTLGGTIAHVTGTSTNLGWARVVTGTTPTCTPFSGAGMARFASYNIVAGNSYSLTFPQITFAGANYRVKFSMFRDGGYSGESDNVKVYYKITTTDPGVLLGTVNRSKALAPIVDNDGWYSYGFDIPGAVTGTGYIMLLGTSSYGNNTFVDNLTVEQIPSMDAEMSSLSINSYAVNGPISIMGSIKNLGLNTITSADITWQVDGGTMNTESLSGLNIAAGSAYDFTHNTIWNATPGQHSISVSISNTNETDVDDQNNELSKTIYIVNEIFPRTVVYEEGTGTWCGWCVRGHIGLKDMEHNHSKDQFIGIAVHNGDPMVVAAYDSAMAGFIGGYPSGIMNRVPTEVDPDISTLESSFQAELLRVPLAKVDIPTQSWNPTTRQITFDVESIFALDMANSNYKFASVIVENGVTGTASGYNQANYYNSNGIDIFDWEGINWRNLGNPIQAASMVYNHVGRALLGGFSGFAGSVPTAVTYNVPYTYSFTHTLPATQNAENISIVALLLDGSNGQIVNAKEVDLDTTLATNNFSKASVSVYPNPSNGSLRIRTENNVSVELVDVLGKVVFASKNVNNDSVLDISSLNKGIYLVKITGENINYTEKVILN